MKVEEGLSAYLRMMACPGWSWEAEAEKEAEAEDEGGRVWPVRTMEVL